MAITAFESMLALIHIQYQPPVLFMLGLFASMLACLIAVVVDSNRRRLGFESVESVERHFDYRRFHNELSHSPRHVDVIAHRIQELDDHDLLS